MPGATCDCGHQACYHREAPSVPAEYVAQAAAQAALENRVRQLEAELHYERQTREREARVLREALHPFYQNVEGMRQMVMDLEDRVDANYDEQARLKDRVLAVDDTSMSFERRLDELQATRLKRRRISRQVPNGVSNDTAPASRKPSDELSPESSSRIFASRSISPTGPQSMAHHPQEPRSSGILNLVRLRGSPPFVPSRHISPPPHEEARSSGFLALDLAERLASKATGAQSRAFAQPARPSTSATATIQNGTQAESKPAADVPPKFADAIEVQELSLDDPLKKRKRSDGLMPLDVLANVSAVSPMAR